MSSKKSSFSKDKKGDDLISVGTSGKDERKSSVGTSGKDEGKSSVGSSGKESYTRPSRDNLAMKKSSREQLNSSFNLKNSTSETSLKRSKSWNVLDNSSMASLSQLYKSLASISKIFKLMALASLDISDLVVYGNFCFRWLQQYHDYFNSIDKNRWFIASNSLQILNFWLLL
jgi:hypothetical protein